MNLSDNKNPSFNAAKTPNHLAPPEQVASRKFDARAGEDNLAKLYHLYPVAAQPQAVESARSEAAGQRENLAKVIPLFPETVSTQITAAPAAQPELAAASNETAADHVTPHITAISTPIQSPSREDMIAAASDAIKRAPSELTADDEEARWREVDKLLASVFSYEPTEPKFPHEESNFLDDEVA